MNKTPLVRAGFYFWVNTVLIRNIKNCHPRVFLSGIFRLRIRMRKIPTNNSCENDSIGTVRGAVWHDVNKSLPWPHVKRSKNTFLYYLVGLTTGVGRGEIKVGCAGPI